MKRWTIVLVVVALFAASGSPAASQSSSQGAGAEGGPETRRPGADQLEAATASPAAGHRDALLGKAATTGPSRWMIRLADPAVPTYEGGKGGLERTAPRQGQQLDADSAPVQEYRQHLQEEQVEFVDRMERALDRAVEVPFTYQFAVNGLVAVLTQEEAAELTTDPAVASIAPDAERELHTDVGPQWINADALWSAVEELDLPSDVHGEGVVIGTIDTGINPSNPSFADVGDDGYNHTNPLGAGNYVGVCDEDNPAGAGGFDPTFPCNDKLIGAYDFIVDPVVDSARDYDGHGSHTASTSGGNVVDDVVVTTASGFVTPEFDISGVAPHANVIAYRGCCSLSGLTASIDQAIADEVDVINYSIGSSAPSAAWDDFDTLGFLSARQAGIFVATSNGNDGPNDATTGSPADVPWLTSVGASTHNRHNGNILTDLDGSLGPLADIEGKSVTGSLGVTPIVDAADVGDPFCLDDTGHEAAFTGNIVVCTRGGGGGGRVEKSQFVKDQGAVGFVLTNDDLHADSLLGDEYAVPGVFISFDDGEALRAWLATGTGHEGAIAGTEFSIDDARGDIMASFSSRGPNRAMDTIVPAVTAPGVDILAAFGVDDPDPSVHGFISGTSMASPHVAGTGALLSQARADWTPAQMQSALMTTALSTVLNHDGDPATPYAQGSGRVDVGRATLAGLLFDESFANYMAANPEDGGDPKTLNLPSFANSECLVTCSWERTASVPANPVDAHPVPDDVTWTATTTSDAGLELEVVLSVATVSPGDSMDITVNADVGSSTVGETLFGRITLTPSDDSVPEVTMPVAVVPSAGVIPDALDVTTRRNAGSQVETGLESIALTDFTASVAGMVKATELAGSLNQDPTNADPYDNLAQVGVHTVNVPAGSTRLVAEVLDAEMPDLDMFVGTGSTPNLETEVCVSASGGPQEKCDIPDPAAGTWWIVVQNWEGSGAQPDAYTLAMAVVPSTDLGNAGVEGPEGPLGVGVPYDIRFHWDIPTMAAGERWYGTASLGTSPGTPGNIGSFPVTILREDDDVTKEASVESAEPGDTISYDITVQPNVTPEDLHYTIVDTVPVGLEIDEGSVTGGGVVDGQTITWEVDVPTPIGVVGDYAVTNSVDDVACAENSGFQDLGAPPIDIPLNPALDGDSFGATAFGNVGPFEQYGQEFPNLVVSEDGLITVTGGYGGEPFTPQDIPDTDAPNGVMAPLWSDLELSVADNRGMRLATAPGVAVVQWDDPFEWTDDDSVGDSVGTFQAWIFAAVDPDFPEITFDFETIGALPAEATIGIERILGDHATAVLNTADPATVLEDGISFCLDYEGPSFDPATFTYDVAVTDEALAGPNTNAADHITDDPFAETATASATVNIVGGACSEPPFTDVPIANPFCREIEWMNETGISEGFADGTYRPTNPVSRQAMSAFMARLAEAEVEPCTEKPFTDVPISNPFCSEITWMADTGISEGFPDGTYRPTNPVSRQAMSAFMARLAEADLEPCTETPFTDVPISNPFCPDITWMADTGIATGFDEGNFFPARPVSRQAMSAFMYRLAHLEN